MTITDVVQESDKTGSRSADGENAAVVGKQRPKRADKRKPLLKVAVAAALLGAAALGARYLLHAMAYESTDDAFIEGRIVQVSPRVMGHVLKVYVNDNQRVERGDPLVELDPADFQARLEQAKAAAEAARVNLTMTKVTAPAGTDRAQAAVDAARANVQAAQARVQSATVRLDQAKAQVSAAQALIEQAKAQVASAEAQASQAQNDLERYQQIAATGGVTKQELDKARTAATVAEAALNAARKGVIAAEAQLAAAIASEAAAQAYVWQEQAGVDSANAALAQAQAQFTEANTAAERIHLSQAQYDQAAAAVEQAELQLKYTTIHAPMAGRVTRKSVEPGEWVQVGQALLAIVPQDVWVVANYKETQLTHMRVGQPAELYVDAYPGHVFKGHVDSIQAGTGAKVSLLPPENATGNFVKVVQRVPVKIVLDEQPGDRFHLGPGMSVIAEVKVK
jgi:membrane fusion protein (multidrug efflux system)